MWPRLRPIMYAAKPRLRATRSSCSAGRTARDGIGGATGASKAHNVESLELDGAEVQKGNAPVERKLQRLFRRGDACRLIKRCNDFGAGGVSVAVGELADGLYVDLNKVSKKYEAWTAQNLRFPNLRSAWPWTWQPKTSTSSSLRQGRESRG